MKVLRASIVLLLAALLLGGCGRAQFQPAGAAIQQPALGAGEVVMADGYRLPLHRWGPEGPASLVVLGLHGFGDHGNAFAALSPVLAEPGQIVLYAYDQRGFGATERPGIWAGSDTLVGDLHAVVGLLRERHPAAPILLAAESMGGAVALVALTRKPALDVEGAVLLAPAVWGKQAMPWYQRLGLRLMVRFAPGATVSGDTVADLGIRPTDDPEVIRALREDPLVQKEARVDTLYGVTRLMSEALEASSGFGVPVLLLYGLNDHVIPPGPVCHWLKRVADAQDAQFRVILYPGGYHMLTRYRAASRTLEDIAVWLADREAALTAGEEVPLEEARTRICALPPKGFREFR